MSLEKNQEASVSVLLLRLHKKEILIPKAMVADVLSWNEELFLQPKTSGNDWNLGEVIWNDWRIPLICFESLMDAEFDHEPMSKRKIVVVKAFQKGFENEHYAIQCRGFPKPLIIGEQSLNSLDVEDNQDWIAYSISIGSRVLDIPEFSILESTIWSRQLPVSHSA